MNKIMTFIFILKITKMRNIKRIILFITKRYILRKNIPAVAICALTYRCQCKCMHCSASRYQTKSEELGIFQWKKVLEKIAATGNLRLHITGGEPMLKQDFSSIVEFACKLGFFVFIETNGEYLTEESIKRLKSLGVNSIDISIDNANADIHNKLRNRENLFDKALSGIKLCKKHRVPVMLSSYATNENIADKSLFDLINFAQEIKTDTMRIMPPQPSGKWLGKNHYKLTKQSTQELKKNMPYFFTVLDRTPLPKCPIKSRFTMFIAPDGEVHPCPHLPFSFGNVKHESIDNILDRMAKEQMFTPKNICYINDPSFVEKYIIPIKDKSFPIKKY